MIGAAVLQKTKLSLEEQERVDAVVIFGGFLCNPPLFLHSLAFILHTSPCWAC